MDMKTWLVTGGAGFIGSNFVRHVLSQHDDVLIVNADNLTYAGNLENLKGLEDHDRYHFKKLDIANRTEVETLFNTYAFDGVFNFAAESHVDRSIHFGVDAFIQTNIQGTQNLLDFSVKSNIRRFLQVSTDEVYGSLGESGRFTEETPVAPNNPYSATKAGADFLVRAAGRTHDLDVVITRCSNNFGPYQFPEKLIPLMIANALEEKPLPVYGDGQHVRDWIYVTDHCEAIDQVFHQGVRNEVYNIGGMYDVPNIDIVRHILEALDKPESLITYVKDRPGHDRRYAMSIDKIQQELHWTPRYTFKDALQKTIHWYLENREWLEHVRSGVYQQYYSSLYQNR